MTGWKHCYHCNIYRPLSWFRRDKRVKDKKSRICAKCHADYMRRYMREYRKSRKKRGRKIKGR